MITIGYSTRVSNPEYKKYIQDTCMYKEVQIIEKVNNGEKSLSKVYNEIIEESNHNIVVLLHDDLEFETKNWGDKLLKHYSKNPEYGIIGVAGSKFLPETGRWWDVPQTMYGIVNHKNEGKKWTSTYSKDLGNKIEEVVLVDGLFISFDKTKIKHKFDEEFNGFHFYDLSFCIPNYLSDVKIGVITDVRLTHLSIGMTNEIWEKNRAQFVGKYKNNFPIDITNQGVCDTFIFCHDQDIILEYEQNKKFNHIKNYKYVFLGGRPTDKIQDNNKIIIAKNLEHNMEEYPNINSYTGWYALWKNKLIKTPYVNLFEYDVVLSKSLEQVISKYLYEEFKIIGYVPIPCNNFHFINNSVWVSEIFSAIKEIYKIDLEKTIRIILSRNPNMMWSSTSNCTMNTSFFNSYMEWFNPIVNKIKESKTAGHAHERSITFYCYLKQLNPLILNNLMKHYQMNSHGTQDHVVDFDNQIKELITN